MPIADDLYTVYKDGRPIFRGLHKSQAYAQAETMANGFWKKRDNDKRRVPYYEVRLDKQLADNEERLYKWAKQEGG